MNSAATHIALEPRTDRDGRACPGVLRGLADFGIRLVGVLREKIEALRGDARSTIELASPHARLGRLLCRILAFEMRLKKEAANPKPSTPAAEPAAKAEASKLEAAEAEPSCAEALERDLERDGERERREGREEIRKALRLYEWAKLPFDEVVALICKEFESIARAIGDDPLVQEAKALAAKVLRPPPPDPQPLPAPNRGRLPPDALQAALRPAALPRAPPDASSGALRGRLLGSVPALPQPLSPAFAGASPRPNPKNPRRRG